MANASPVFIVGTPRGGTTLLSATLMRHSSFRIRDPDSPYALVESHVFRRPWELGQIQTACDHQTARFMFDNPQLVEQLRQRIGPIITRRRHLLGHWDCYQTFVQRLNRARLVGWRMMGYHQLVRLFFYFAQLARGSKRVLEKTPDHAFTLEEIWATFPRAKVVFVYRHPVDVYSSYRKYLLRYLKSLAKPYEWWGWTTVSPIVFARDYERRLIAGIKATKQHTDHLTMVRYEDLVSDPPATLRGLCQAIDEPFEPALLKADGQATNLVARKQIVTQTKSWSDYLREDEARAIENRLTWLMGHLSQKRYTDPG